MLSHMYDLASWLQWQLTVTHSFYCTVNLKLYFMNHMISTKVLSNTWWDDQNNVVMHPLSCQPQSRLKLSCITHFTRLLTHQHGHLAAFFLHNTVEAGHLDNYIYVFAQMTCSCNGLLGAEITITVLNIKCTRILSTLRHANVSIGERALH